MTLSSDNKAARRRGKRQDTGLEWDRMESLMDGASECVGREKREKWRRLQLKFAVMQREWKC